VQHVLRLVGRTEIPVAAGIDVAAGRFRDLPDYPSDAAYWGGPVPPVPGPAEAALALLRRSLDAGATLLGIGPWTNLAVLEETHPGSLSRASLVLMGTCVVPPRRGYPSWGPELDYNVQLDAAAARTVLGASTPVVVPLGPCLETAVRRAHVPRLRTAGPLGALLARQAEQFDHDVGNADRWAVEAPALPPDTINCLHDPLACGIALGWRTGVRIEPVHLRLDEVDGWLVACAGADGRLAQVVTEVDGPAFSEAWLQRIERGGRW
jgi:inosine-uridine nucleoside N-ribohydrolase